MAYCTAQEIARSAGLENVKDAQLAQLEEMAIQASDEFDRKTGTWHESRKVRVTTQAAHEGQLELLLPAPVLSLTSVKLDGDLLAPEDYEIRGTRLTLASGAAWPTGFGLVIIEGELGSKPVPPAVNLAVREMGATMSGLKIRTFINGEGVAQAVTVTKLPDWVEQRIEAMRFRRFIAQDWTVERIP